MQRVIVTSMLQTRRLFENCVYKSINVTSVLKLVHNSLLFSALF
jgi:hypothetical protein